MDFTREPIIESIITSRDGFRLVVRSSKNVGHEEYFVDALEMVTFGSSVFFRSNEKPKPFLVPACDYEVCEVREPRVLLKTPSSIEGIVKISSSKESAPKMAKEPPLVRSPSPVQEEKIEEHSPLFIESESSTLPLHLEEVVQSPVEASHALQEKKREKKNRHKKKKNPVEIQAENSVAPAVTEQVQESLADVSVHTGTARIDEGTPPIMRNVLPPPDTLIRDDIERLRKDKTFQGAFFIKDDSTESKEGDDDDAPIVPKRLIFDEEDNESLDEYKATPAKSSVKETREPFWISPSVAPTEEK